MEPQWALGRGTLLSEKMYFAVSYFSVFVAGEFALLWDVREAPQLPEAARLRWRSADGAQTKYFRVLGVAQCEFPGVHIDLRVREELTTPDEIKARQNEIAKKLTALANTGFTDELPPRIIPLEDLFRYSEKQSQREMLRHELGDLAAMLDSLTRTT